MRFAVASRDGILVDQHFGHADKFLIYEANGSGVTFLESREVAPYCGGECAPAERLEALISEIRDCAQLLCLRIGYSPAHSLMAAGITPVEAHGPIEEIVASLVSRDGEGVLWRLAWAGETA